MLPSQAPKRFDLREPRSEQRLSGRIVDENTEILRGLPEEKARFQKTAL
jgi:hypothetical protein